MVSAFQGHVGTLMSSLCCQVLDTTQQLSPNLEHNRHDRKHGHFRMLTASLLHTFNLPESFYQPFLFQWPIYRNRCWCKKCVGCPEIFLTNCIMFFSHFRLTHYIHTCANRHVHGTYHVYSDLHNKMLSMVLKASYACPFQHHFSSSHACMGTNASHNHEAYKQHMYVELTMSVTSETGLK